MRTDFDFLKLLGKGSYGEVHLVRKDEKLYAIKELDKDFIIGHGKTESVFRERNILQAFDHPSFPKLYTTF